MIMRLRYARHWLRFKIKNLVHPYRWITPACPLSWSFERTKFGFILWGRGKRRHFSWRTMLDGPCSFATYRTIHKK